MSKARELANLGNAYSDGALSNRNLIINGAMQVAQRGTSLTLSDATEYLIDRYRTYKDHSATATVSQSSDAPSGFTKSWLITVGTGATTNAANELQVAHVIEGYNASVLALGTSGAKPITISFWVKSSLTGTFAFSLLSQGAASTYVETYTISSANTWEYKTVTIQGHTGGSWNTTNGVGLALTFDLGGGSNFEASTGSWSTGNKYTTSGTTKVAGTSGATWQITGVQLEVGDTATPFEHRSYGDELARCQRYYEKQTGLQSCEQGIVANTTTNREHVEKWVVVKRAIPSVTFSTQGYYCYSTGTVDTGTATVVNFPTVHSALLGTTGCPARVAGDTVAVERCVYEADAEL